MKQFHLFFPTKPANKKGYDLLTRKENLTQSSKKPSAQGAQNKNKVKSKKSLSFAFCLFSHCFEIGPGRQKTSPRPLVSPFFIIAGVELS